MSDIPPWQEPSEPELPPPPASAPGGPAGTFPPPPQPGAPGSYPPPVGEFGTTPPPPGAPQPFQQPPPFPQSPPGQPPFPTAPPGQPPFGQQPFGQPYGSLRDNPTNTIAITSLVLGILSIFCLGCILGIPAIICGVIGIKKAEEPGGSGKGLAVAGIVLGSIGSFVWMLSFIPLFTSSN